jgi:hypothetical protein
MSSEWDLLILRVVVMKNGSGDGDRGGGEGSGRNGEGSGRNSEGCGRNSEGSGRNGRNWEVEQIKGTDSEGTMLMTIELEWK